MRMPLLRTFLITLLTWSLVSLQAFAATGLNTIDLDPEEALAGGSYDTIGEVNGSVSKISEDTRSEVNACKPDFSGINVPIYSWPATSGHPKAIVLAFHGGCLDGQAFTPLGNQLSKQDITLVSFDMRGFGKWYHDKYGTKHNRTFRYNATREDVANILQRLRKQFPRVPIICMGESLGANMAMAIAGTNPNLVDGAILCSPYCGPQFILYPQMLRSLGAFLKRPWAELDMSPYLLRRLAHERHMSIAHINNQRNRDKQSALELIRSWRLNKFGMEKFPEISEKTPVLVLVGELDRLCKPEDSTRYFKTYASKNCKYIVVPRQGHLMVETEFLDSKILSMISDWVDETQRPSLAKKDVPSDTTKEDGLTEDRRHNKQGLRELNTFAYH